MGAVAAERCDSERQERGDVVCRDGRRRGEGGFPSVARLWRVPNA